MSSHLRAFAPAAPSVRDGSPPHLCQIYPHVDHCSSGLGQACWIHSRASALVCSAGTLLPQGLGGPFPPCSAGPRSRDIPIQQSPSPSTWPHLLHLLLQRSMYGHLTRETWISGALSVPPVPTGVEVSREQRLYFLLNSNCKLVLGASWMSNNETVRVERREEPTPQATQMSILLPTSP